MTNTALVPAVIDFEVYLLMTMKLRISMSHKESQLEARLAERWLSLGDAERIHEQVAEALGAEASRFENLKNLLGIPDNDARSLKYRSVLWPEFDFTAIAGEVGRLESARYRRAEAIKLASVPPLSCPSGAWTSPSSSSILAP